MKKKRRNPIHAYKHLLAKDYDWDYGYLIALEKKKLQRMHDCIKRENHLANNEFVVREIAICIRLIDIFMENDSVHNTWLERAYSGTRIQFRKLDDGNYEMVDDDKDPLPDIPIYVNTRNEKRFFRSAPIKDALAEDRREYSIHLKISLRQQKALHLYHMIREYKLFGWWD
jgi:hypothetical protein